MESVIAAIHRIAAALQSRSRLNALGAGVHSESRIAAATGSDGIAAAGQGCPGFRLNSVLSGCQVERGAGNADPSQCAVAVVAGTDGVAAERIMERVWGWNSEAEVNVVWVHISNLRKKLKAIGSSVTIRASRGLGYALVEEGHV